MPVYNEAQWIRRSLGAVLEQDYPVMEIIVADGLSTDGTRDIVRQLCASFPSVTLIDNPTKYAAAGLNRALEVARGDVIVRVDGHCEIAPDYVSTCVRHIKEDNVQVVGGPLDTIGETPMSQTIAVAQSSRFGVGNSAFRTLKNKTRLVDTVAFPAFTRDVIAKAGRFDEELVRDQDDEFNYRVRKQGAKILLADDVHARYYARASLLSLWRQYFGYGYWKVRVMHRHPGQMSLRQFVPPLFVLALFAGALLSPWFSGARLCLALLLLIYTFSCLAASAVNAAQYGWSHFLPLPIVFVALHISYGLGFLIGLAHFYFHRDARSILRESS